MLHRNKLFAEKYCSLTCNIAFLIGSIEEVNKKISSLDRKLQSYTALVIESRASEKSDVDSLEGSFISDRSRGHDYEKMGKVYGLLYILN